MSFTTLQLAVLSDYVIPRPLVRHFGAQSQYHNEYYC